MTISNPEEYEGQQAEREAEYQRLMALDWVYRSYPDPVREDYAVLPPMTFMVGVAQDDENVVLRWYSAQPAPEFTRDPAKLPDRVEIIRRLDFFDRHYVCFVWLSSGVPMPWLLESGKTLEKL